MYAPRPSCGAGPRTMAYLDWTLVVFGMGIALTGSWIQLHPERLYPNTASNWQMDPALLGQIRMLGGCFLCMGTFFTLQMSVDLVRLPWWIGTLGGVMFAIASVKLVGAWSRQQGRPQSGAQQAARAERR